MQMLHCRARRRYARGLKRKPLALIKRLRKAKKEAGPLDKPAVIKTHLRDTIIVPEMVGGMVAVHNGKTFNQIEIKVQKINVAKWCMTNAHVQVALVQDMCGLKLFFSIFKAEMIGHYLGEFSLTYKPVKHGRPGIGATHSSRFIPLR
jgi:small subunit ribosomal protein S15e